MNNCLNVVLLAPAATAGPSTDDPFAMAMQEQQKLQYEKMQKEQAEKLAQQNAAASQPGGSNTGITPNMFMQQMFTMMQNQGSGNQQQNAMMMAAMQNMMSQMSMNNQQNEAPKEEPKPEPAFPPQEDKSNGAFKSLFNNAAGSAMTGGGAARHSDLGGAPQSNAFGAFGGSAAPSAPQRTSEPANPFGDFGASTMPGSAPPATNTEQNNMFGTPFSNSGWSGGEAPQSQASAQPSSNPFDMFK